jgi:hypothetical protein
LTQGRFVYGDYSNYSGRRISGNLNKTTDLSQEEFRSLLQTELDLGDSKKPIDFTWNLIYDFKPKPEECNQIGHITSQKKLSCEAWTIEVDKTLSYTQKKATKDFEIDMGVSQKDFYSRPQVNVCLSINEKLNQKSLIDNEFLFSV